MVILLSFFGYRSVTPLFPLSRKDNFYILCTSKYFALLYCIEIPIAAVDRFTDMYRYLPIYQLSADISVLQIRKILIGIGSEGGTGENRRTDPHLDLGIL